MMDATAPLSSCAPAALKPIASGACAQVSDGLAERSLLDALSGPARDELLAIAQPVSFSKGSVLLRQGAHTRGAFFLTTGEAAVTVQLPGGDDLTVAQVGPGGVIGEMALLEHGMCSATVTAASEVDGFFVGRDDFRVLVARRSAAAIVVQQAVTLNLCAKLGALNDKTLAWRPTEDHAYVAPPQGDPLQSINRKRALAFDFRRFLPVLPVFHGWDAEEIAALADMAHMLELPRGQHLFYENAEATACFITVRGAVEIAAPVAQGTDLSRLPASQLPTPSHLRRLAVHGPGRLLGHRSLIENKPHASRARACEDSLVLELTAAQFRGIYQGSSSLSYRLQAAVHASLLRAMAQSNLTLTRLVNLAKVDAAKRAPLNAVLAEQVVYAS